MIVLPGLGTLEEALKLTIKGAGPPIGAASKFAAGAAFVKLPICRVSDKMLKLSETSAQSVRSVVLDVHPVAFG